MSAVFALPTARHLALTCLVALTLAASACSDDGGAKATPSAVGTTATTPTIAPTVTRPIATPVVTASATPRPPAAIELGAAPQKLSCDGVQSSVVTARVLDQAGQPVVDGTRVTFSVVALGAADPIEAETVAGQAKTSVTAIGRQVGVVVNVTSGDAATAIRIDCL